MPNKIDLTGKTFTRLTVIGFDRTEKANNRSFVRWLVRCTCGKEFSLRAGALSSGNTKSCGCLHRERASERIAKRNATHKKTDTPTWRSWSAMFTRCENKNAKTYKDYGARGISVCERWRKFENFLADMGERPQGTSIDRFPNIDGNYEPGNCRWATITEQNRNKRDTRKIEINGETRSFGEWADHFQIPRSRAYARVYRGWSAEKALEINPLHPDVPLIVARINELEQA